MALRGPLKPKLYLYTNYKLTYGRSAKLSALKACQTLERFSKVDGKHGLVRKNLKPSV